MVNQLLLFREQLASKRKASFSKNASCLIQFSINLPGEDKFRYPAENLIRIGKEYLIKFLVCHESSSNIVWEHKESPMYVAFAVCRSSPTYVKRHLLKMESQHLLGACWDFDVFDKNLNKISRIELGYPDKPCFVCTKPAKICSAKQAHSLNNIFHIMVEKYTTYLSETL